MHGMFPEFIRSQAGHRSGEESSSTHFSEVPDSPNYLEVVMKSEFEKQFETRPNVLEFHSFAHVVGDLERRETLETLDA